MKPIPQNIITSFNILLQQRKVHPMYLADYRKWLFYFLDFRAKYSLPDAPTDQVRLFADKLRSKNQTAVQVKQAEEAISLYSLPGRETTSGLRWPPAPLPPRRGRTADFGQRLRGSQTSFPENSSSDGL